MEKITIKSYEELEKLAAKFHEDGFDLPDGSFFNYKMKKWCGKTIKVRRTPEDEDCYNWVSSDYHWSELMVEGKSDRFKQIYQILNSQEDVS
jgi:hypothetical protein